MEEIGENPSIAYLVFFLEEILKAYSIHSLFPVPYSLETTVPTFSPQTTRAMFPGI
jgi:hypothetical protein